MASVVAVCASSHHTFSKPSLPSITIIAGIGVAGDTHSGELVQHEYLVRKDPTQPNLRQVHLIQAELFDHVADAGFTVAPGELGENVTTRGVDLLSLPTGTLVHLGDDAVIELTGLRNPGSQIDDYQDGLMRLLRYKGDDGSLVRIGGVMAIVTCGGVIRPGDTIETKLPPEPHLPLEYVANSHEPVRVVGSPGRGPFTLPD